MTAKLPIPRLRREEKRMRVAAPSGLVKSVESASTSVMEPDRPALSALFKALKIGFARKE
ncbi:hypothetical protein N7481_003646 [Penicillium waksmanii]|uniref:uncharacterized protein n=1 Tax=Penicillium waksmanii TaxID=69791 RepID=UPI0025482A3A|nr:uncharacterized protein N7481_003646 [Penicillium waksmanii]KAJ5988436.1 hypothetical protein N7481_003646 [Penicillium waksmanii]